MYNLRMLFGDAARCGARKDVSEKTWKAFCAYVEEIMKMGKGIKVPKFGCFTSKRNSERDSFPGIKNHVFFLVPTFARSYGVQPKKVGPALLSPCLEFNWAKLAFKAELDKDLAQTTLEVLFRTLGQAIASGQACRILFGEVGVMVVQQREVTFKFAPPPGLRSFARAADPDGEFPGLGDSGGLSATAKLLHDLTESSAGEGHHESAPEGEEEEPLRAPPPVVASVVAPSLDVEGPLGGDGPSSRRGMTSGPVGAAMTPSGTAESRGASERVRRHHARGGGGGAPTTARSQQDEHSVSIFPRFTSKDGRSRMKHNPAVDRNLALSYERARRQMQMQRDRDTRIESEMLDRQQSSTKDLLDKAARQRSKQEELNSYLKQQAAEHHARLAQQRVMDQQTSEGACGRVFPAEKQLDLRREMTKKLALRDALDEQVEYKKRLAADQVVDEVAREKFLLSCLEQQVRQERIELVEKREKERRTLAEAWELQKSFRDFS